MEPPSQLIDARIEDLDDWRGEMHVFTTSQLLAAGSRAAEARPQAHY